MKKNCMSLLVFLLMMVFSCSVFADEAQTQEAGQSTVEQASNSNSDIKAAAKRWLLINVPARSLRVYDDDRCIAMYPVGVGKIVSKTPAGYYKVVEKIVNPTWTDPGDTSLVIPSGPDNPLGYRWIGIGGNYGIHGTNRPETVGNYVSNGCVRMVEANVEKVFDMVEVGTPVQIIYDRLVIDKTQDNRVAYYIYPDGYDMQNVTVDFVKKGLAGYGIADFATDDSITKAIEASNGQPNYVAAPINIMMNGTKLPFKAVNYQNLIYVPVKPLATQLQANVNVNNSDSMITTTKGSADVAVYGNNPYIRLTDLQNVFDVNYTLDSKFTTVTLTPVAAKTETATTADVKADGTEQKTVSNKDVNVKDTAKSTKTVKKVATKSDKTTTAKTTDTTNKK